MSGALKHFFDQLYYVGLDVTRGRPYGMWVHGDNDATGCVRSVEKVAGALDWRKAAEPVCVVGSPDAEQRAALGDLAATVGALIG